MDTPDRVNTATLFTIGHSNRPLEVFLSLLNEYGIRCVADIRRFPSSRKFPHFNRPHLCASLESQGIEYLWFEALGGRRPAQKDSRSPNSAIKAAAFRSYADYMLTEAFETAVQELLILADRLPTAVMCAEMLYWKCHRRFLCDFLTARGARVNHIVESGSLAPHKMMPEAKVREDGRLIYPDPLFS